MGVKTQERPIPTPQKPWLFLSNQSRVDLVQSLLKSINCAKEHIAISVYSLTDPKIIEALNKQAKKGLSVEIAIDKSHARSLKKKLVPSVQVSTFKQRGLMHQKIFLIDDTVYLGSANLTTQSLRMHDNLLLGLYSPKLHRFLYQELFTQSAKINSFKEANFELYLLPNKECFQRVIELLNGAKKSIYIAMFTFTHPQVLEALILAKQRGVDVSVVVDHLSEKGASHKLSQRLYDEKIAVSYNRGQALMHHKLAFIDDETFIFGSTNWTKSGFEKNIECLLVLSKLSGSEKSFIKKLWRDLKWESKKIEKDYSSV